MKPVVFAAVMATGIVSISAADYGFSIVSQPLAVLAVVALGVLMYAAAVRRQTFDWQDLDTVIGLFTYVAACAVLAARFAEYAPAVWIFGALGLSGWLSLMPMALTRMRRLGIAALRGRARGTWELVSVATSGLAIVFMAAGILFWAFIFWLIALGLYGLMTGLIAWRAIGEPEVRRDVPADHWILMGGAAIATLAGEHIHAALHPGPIADAVLVVTIATLVVAAVQIVPLALTSWRQILDWPAVFPLGMFSAASYAVSIETGWHPMVVVSHVFFWIAFAAWLAVAVVLIRRVVRLTSEHGLRPR
ncbi:C4-dicarboxylate ABC transporter [Mycobacterium sp. E802]|uniref:tellurite resistance/C4-dicarboxylate transporter family protein n=1 Tax=Mycobacterium sp. E802 TaxID=1834152 RepID=UPI00080212AC|nr:tellurite resistance/C4-dicarboxylate transporter family protein [Mycobacterium sp. E802]OBG83189.1 C4-dicarboxylate ABC transporter [Mycobacterium sp. E802]